jgi:hypothetical protein
MNMSESIHTSDTVATPAPVVAAPSTKKAKASTAPKVTAQAAAKATKKTAPASKAKPLVSKPAETAKAPVTSPVKASAAPTGKPPKAKLKLVRDSFTMPHADFELIDLLKQRAMNFRHAVKKGELLRAGLQVLAALSDVQLEKALARITPLKTGRPKKAG